MKKKISYQELCDDYLGNIILANDLFTYLLRNFPDEFNVESGELYTYFNRYSQEITREQWEECSLYNLEGEQEPIEFCQYYLIDYSTVETLKEISDQTIISFPELNAAFWCIPFYGTSWKYTYTTIEIEN